MGGYIKSIQGLEDHFSTQNEHNDHLAIIKLIHFPGAQYQKWGVQNDRLDKGNTMEHFDKFVEFSNFSISTIFDDNLPPLNRFSK